MIPNQDSKNATKDFQSLVPRLILAPIVLKSFCNALLAQTLDDRHFDMLLGPLWRRNLQPFASFILSRYYYTSSFRIPESTNYWHGLTPRNLVMLESKQRLPYCQVFRVWNILIIIIEYTLHKLKCIPKPLEMFKVN